MRPEVKKFLFDINDAAQSIFEFLKGKDFEDYNESDFLRSAVERKLMIIGEAVGQALHIDPDLEQIIPQARKIVDFRNILVHGYSAIENQTVWGIVRRNLPMLQQQVAALLCQ